MNHEATNGTYDVVVGGGIAGLTAGAFLAQAGKQVLVIEQERRPVVMPANSSMSLIRSTLLFT